MEDECQDPRVIDIKSETLVDNGLTGSFSVAHALAIQKELLRVLAKG